MDPVPGSEADISDLFEDHDVIIIDSDDENADLGVDCIRVAPQDVKAEPEETTALSPPHTPTPSEKTGEVSDSAKRRKRKKKRKRDRELRKSADSATPSSEKPKKKKRSRDGSEKSKRRTSDTRISATPGKLSVWSLVKKNIRGPEDPMIVPPPPKTPEEGSGLDASQTLAADVFDILGGPPTGEDGGDVLGLFDGVDSRQADGPQLQMDDAGNFVMMESSADFSFGGGAGDMTSVFEGRGMTAENYDERGRPPAFTGAYNYTKPALWSKEDNERFYQALEVFGTDLFLVRSYLPEFTEKQILLKFKREERRNRGKLDEALGARKSVSVDDFEKLHGAIDKTTHYRPQDDPNLDSDEELGIILPDAESAAPKRTQQAASIFDEETRDMTNDNTEVEDMFGGSLPTEDEANFFSSFETSNAGGGGGGNFDIHDFFK